jgi:hypothetical protein
VAGEDDHSSNQFKTRSSAVREFPKKMAGTIRNFSRTFKGYGWRIIEDVGYDELADKYIVPTGRRLASTPVERMVYAERV